MLNSPTDLLESMASDTQSPTSPAGTPRTAAQVLSQWLPVEDLTAQAAHLDPAIVSPFDGVEIMERLFDEIARALHRSEACHVMLQSERGAQEVNLVAELARRAAVGHIPTLRTAHLLLVDGRFVAGDQAALTLEAILELLKAGPETILCLRGLCTLLAKERGDANERRLLCQLDQLRGRIIALVSPQEADSLVADDEEIAEHFIKLAIPEPDIPLSLALVNHYCQTLAAVHDVVIADEAVRAAVTLSSNYIFHEQLPGKALRVLRRACEDVKYEHAQFGRHGGVIDESRIVDVVSSLSGVPGETLRGVAENCDYGTSLRELILGQDHVVDEVAAELGLIKAGFADVGKPATVMMFIGQTGTGKTELAKALARLYSTSKRLRTYTLGNFVESHSVAGIIGVPPGYVGHEQGGRLINDLVADPYCVFLLDEADKAHPDVLQPFLNLFDEGWISDQRGRRARADKAMFILTTNVGQRMIGDLAKQGKSWDEITQRMKESLSQLKHTKSNRPVFSPEFLARIRRVIVFKPLDARSMSGIAKKIVREICDGWKQRRAKELVVDPRLVEWIGREAHRLNDRSQGREGGRIVRKLVAEQIESPLQRQISVRPQDYRQADAIEVACENDEMAKEVDSVPCAVTVRFHSLRGIALHHQH